MPDADATLERDRQGRPCARRDRDGLLAWSIAWHADALAQAWLRLPLRDDAIALHAGGGSHPLLGTCDRVLHGDVVVARVAAIDWRAPTWIPAVDVPGALPPGAGTVLLDLIATLAREAGTPRLRYRGPYPTAALYDALASSFVADGDRDRFCAPLEHEAIAARMLEPAVGFVPAPHRRDWPAARICVQSRDRVERVWIDGCAFDARTGAARRLLPHGEGWRACLVAAGEVLAERAQLDREGRPIAALSEPAPLQHPCIGLVLPEPMVAVVAQGLAAHAPAPLRAALVRWVCEHPVVFADTGMTLAREHDGALQLHAALAERVLSLPPAQSLALVIEALHEPASRGLARALVGAIADGRAP
ncbi:MAG: hypothetical protein U0168_08280 [Nannocystaceae bacterium]